MEVAIFTLIGIIVGGFSTYLSQRQQFKQQIRILQEENKTEFMAESTVKHYLSHRGYTDRSFNVIRTRLGGFDDDELRKVLVRAGAVRFYRHTNGNKTEWWRLLSRQGEYIAKKKLKYANKN